MKKLFLFLFVATCITSCIDDDTTANTTEVPPNGERGEFFIEAKYNGTLVRADYTPCKGIECEKNHGNYSPKVGYYNFVREFYPPEYEGKIFVYFQDYQLDTNNLPDTLPFENSFSDGKLEFKYYETPTDSLRTYLNINKSLKLVVTSFNNDTLEGSFNGKLFNEKDTNDLKIVSEGKFKVIMYNTD